jgi:hypothetical protein
MPTLLADPPQVLYLLLGGLLIGTGFLAAQRQDRRALIAFAGAFCLMMLLFGIDQAVESPREEAVRRTYTMAMAADAKNPDAFVEQLADRVTIASGNEPGKTLTREEVKTHPFWQTLRAFDVTINVKGFSRDDAKEINDSAVEIGFMGHGTPRGQNSIPVYVRFTYAKQSDGSFKLTTMRFFDPVNHKQGFPIPGFP